MSEPTSNDAPAPAAVPALADAAQPIETEPAPDSSTAEPAPAAVPPPPALPAAAPATPPSRSAVPDPRAGESAQAPEQLRAPHPLYAAFGHIVKLVREHGGDWRDVEDYATDTEAFYAEIDSSETVWISIYAPLLLAYLINDHLPAASHLPPRLHPSLSSYPLLSSLLALAQSADAGPCAAQEVYQRADELRAVCEKRAQELHDPEGEVWEFVGMGLATFGEQYRYRMVTLLGQAFASLPTALAAEYLGMAPADLAPLVHSFGWIHDPAKDTFKPVALQPQRAPPSDLRHLHALTQNVLSLELPV